MDNKEVEAGLGEIFDVLDGDNKEEDNTTTTTGGGGARTKEGGYKLPEHDNDWKADKSVTDVKKEVQQACDELGIGEFVKVKQLENITPAYHYKIYPKGRPFYSKKFSYRTPTKSKGIQGNCYFSYTNEDNQKFETAREQIEHLVGVLKNKHSKNLKKAVKQFLAWSDCEETKENKEGEWEFTQEFDGDTYDIKVSKEES